MFSGSISKNNKNLSIGPYFSCHLEAWLTVDWQVTTFLHTDLIHLPPSAIISSSILCITNSTHPSGFGKLLLVGDDVLKLISLFPSPLCFHSIFTPILKYVSHLATIDLFFPPLSSSLDWKLLKEKAMSFPAFLVCVCLIAVMSNSLWSHGL